MTVLASILPPDSGIVPRYATISDINRPTDSVGFSGLQVHPNGWNGTTPQDGCQLVANPDTTLTGERAFRFIVAPGDTAGSSSGHRSEIHTHWRPTSSNTGVGANVAVDGSTIYFQCEFLISSTGIGGIYASSSLILHQVHTDGGSDEPFSIFIDNKGSGSGTWRLRVQLAPDYGGGFYTLANLGSTAPTNRRIRVQGEMTYSTGSTGGLVVRYTNSAFGTARGSEGAWQNPSSTPNTNVQTLGILDGDNECFHKAGAYAAGEVTATIEVFHTYAVFCTTEAERTAFATLVGATPTTNDAFNLGGQPGTVPYRTGPSASVPGKHRPRKTFTQYAGTAAAPYTFTTTSDSQTITGVDIQGTLVIAHDNVTVRDSRMWDVSVGDGNTDWVIEWCRIGNNWGSHIDYDATDRIPKLGANGMDFLGNNGLVKRCEIFGFADLARARYSGGGGLLECHLHSPFKTHDPFFDTAPYNDTSPNNAHADMMQFLFTEQTTGKIEGCRLDAWPMEAGDTVGGDYWEDMTRAGATSGLFIYNPNTGNTKAGEWRIFDFFLDGNYGQGFYWQNNTGTGTLTSWYVSDGIVRKRRTNYGSTQWANIGYTGNPSVSTLYYGRVLDYDSGSAITVSSGTKTTISTPEALSNYVRLAAASEILTDRQVARSAASASGTRVAGASTGALSFTPSGTNPYLVVGIHTASHVEASAVTFTPTGGSAVTLTKMDEHSSTSGTARRVEQWGAFVSAAAGSVDVTMASSTDFIISAESYTSVDNDEPYVAGFERTSTSTNIWMGTGNSTAAQGGSLMVVNASHLGESTTTPDSALTAGGENESGSGTAAGAWGYADGSSALTEQVFWALGASNSFVLLMTRLQADVTPPDFPTGVYIERDTPTTALTGATMPFDADVTKYHVRIAQGTDFFFYDSTDGTAVATGVSTTPGASVEDVAITGLVSGLAYKVAWFAEDAAGNVSLAATADLPALPGTAEGPTFRAQGSVVETASKAASVTPTLPSGTTAGDRLFLVMQVSMYGGSSTSATDIPTITAPTGWTIPGGGDTTAVDSTGGNSRKTRLVVATKVAVSGETAPSVSMNNDGLAVGAGREFVFRATIFGYSGCDQENTAFVGAISRSSGATTTVLGGQTAARVDLTKMLAICSTSDDNNGSLAAMTNVTNLTERYDTVTTTGADAGLIVYEGDIATEDAITGEATFTITGDGDPSTTLLITFEPPNLEGPSPVTGLTLTEPASGQIKAAFTTSASGDVTHYQIRVKAGPEATFTDENDGSLHTALTTCGIQQSRSHTSSGFTPEVTYTVGVFSRDDAYNWGDPATADITIATPPSTDPGENESTTLLDLARALVADTDALVAAQETEVNDAINETDKARERRLLYLMEAANRSAKNVLDSIEALS